MKLFGYRSVLTFVFCQLLGISLSFEASGNEKIAKRLQSLGAEVERDDKEFVIAVHFGWHSLASDSDLALLQGLKHLAEVNISEMKFTDLGLKHIATLSNLKRLYLTDTKFTDADVNYLIGLSSLEELDLNGTAVSDASIPSLATLQSLKHINLSTTRVTPDGLRLLRRKRPNLYVDETWFYRASLIDGRGVLDTDRVTFVFDDIRGPEGAGGGGGGSIKVSRPQGDDVQASSSGGGFVFGKGWGVIHATASREKGIPTIRVGTHRIEILDEVSEVSVDGVSFRLGSKKERIIVGSDGVAKLDNWQADDAP